jgi:hypothetical protein
MAGLYRTFLVDTVSLKKKGFKKYPEPTLITGWSNMREEFVFANQWRNEAKIAKRINQKRNESRSPRERIRRVNKILPTKPLWWISFLGSFNRIFDIILPELTAFNPWETYTKNNFITRWSYDRSALNIDRCLLCLSAFYRIDITAPRNAWIKWIFDSHGRESLWKS